MRYVTLFTLICVLLSVQFLPAQAPDTLWTRTYGEGIGYCVIETSDSSLVIVGCSVYDYGPGGDLRLLKTNSDGDTIWTKTYGDTNYDDWGYSVRETPDGGFIIVGSTASLGAGDQDVWLLRTDEFGDTLWTKTFGGDSSDVGKCIQITNDGGYIIVGSTESFGAGSEDIWLIKTDPDGNTLWTKTYGDSLYAWGNYVIQTSDSGFALVGGVGWSCWFIKTDSAGDSIWSKILLPWFYIAESRCVLELDSGYLVSYENYGLGGGGSGLVMTNFSGDTLWYQHPSFDISSVIQTNDDNFLCAGGGPYTYTFAPIILFDNTGGLIWRKNPFGSGALMSAIQTIDNSYIATGMGGDLLSDDRLYLCKIGTPTGINQTNDIIFKSFSLSQNYPNPFNPITTIVFDLPKTTEVTLKVFNILGEEAVTLVTDKLSAGSYSYEWDASNFASGVYLYRLQAGDYVETRKMILMR